MYDDLKIKDMEMKSILSNTFDKIFCINVCDGRWEYCRQVFKKYHILDIVERYIGVKSIDNNYKNWRNAINTSHLNIIKTAKKENYNNVLIFEDDIEFLDYKYNEKKEKFKSDPKDILYKALSQLNQHEWDILWLGYASGRIKNYCRIDDNLFRADGQTRTHAYAVNNTVYDMIIKNLPSSTLLIDQFYRHIITPKCKSISICPMICGQNNTLISSRRNIPLAHDKWIKKSLIRYN